MKKLISLFLLTFCVSTFSIAEPALPVVVATDQEALLKSDNPKLEANKRLVYEFWRLVFNTRDMTLADKYMREDYMQHNVIANTGRKPFTDLFSQFPKQPVLDNIPDLVHIMAEGDYVTLAFRREFDDPRTPGAKYTSTWFDMFRIQDGKMAEHWDYGQLPAAQ